jgi:hypothetical protein
MSAQTISNVSAADISDERGHIGFMGDEQGTEHDTNTECAALQQSYRSLYFVLARELHQENEL